METENVVPTEVQEDANAIMEGNEVADENTSSETVLQSDTVHPLMTTSFSDYTVTEGLLLLILLSIIVGGVFNFLKGVF